jgi:hypothetical protein
MGSAFAVMRWCFFFTLKVATHTLLILEALCQQARRRVEMFVKLCAAGDMPAGFADGAAHLPIVADDDDCLPLSGCFAG